jgi:hypothetical protein
MITKLHFALAAALALFIAAPSNVFAVNSSATKAQITKLSAQLKKLTTSGSSASAVSKLVKKLAQLDPKNAAKYFKTGLTKLSNAGGTADADASKLAKDVTKILKKADLPAGTIKSVTKAVTKADDSYTPVAPPGPVS